MAGSAVKLGQLKWFLVLAAFLLAMPLLTSQIYILGLLIQVFIFAVFALSYDLLIGFTGIISFGHALFFGSGAYGAGLLITRWGGPFFLVLLAVALLAAGFALIKGFFSLRVRGLFFAMVTLAFAQFFWVLAQKWTALTGGADGLPGIRTPEFLSTRISFYYFALGFLGLAYVLSWLFVHSPTGRILIGIRENEDRMTMLGINVFLYKIIALTFSGILAALAGAVYGVFINFAYPSLLHLNTTINVLMMAIVGGIGTLHGPILGAAVVQLLSHFLSSNFRQWIIIFGFMYIAIVAFMPMGLFGGFRSLQQFFSGQQKKLRSLGSKMFL